MTPRRYNNACEGLVYGLLSDIMNATNIIISVQSVTLNQNTSETQDL